MRAAIATVVVLSACDGVPRNVDYYSDVKPIIEDHCARCHQPGGIGPFDFSNPETVVSLAGRMAYRTEQGTMPPPVADPDCHDYVGSEHLAMSQRDRDTVQRWADLGAPLGDPAKAVSGTYTPIDLQDPDLHVQIPPYAPVYDDPSNPGNEYRCFLLEHGRDTDFYVTGLHPKVDKASIVHHMVLGAVDRTDLSSDFDLVNGEDCINDDMGAVEHMLAAWAPGSQPQIFESGAGMRVGKDQVLILQMHYYLPGPDAVGLSDESGYDLRTVSEVQTPLEVLTLGSTAFRIPQNDSDYRYAEGYRADRDLKVHGVFPHMHALGSSYRMWKDDDKRDNDCMVAAEQYDFHNQLTYLFPEPIDVAQGQSMNWECAWDNSDNNPDRLNAPPGEVLYGERSDEEMCFFFTIVESE